MERIVGMAEAKSKLAELVGQVKYGGDHFVLERRGQPMAILISVEEYARLHIQSLPPVRSMATLVPDADDKPAQAAARRWRGMGADACRACVGGGEGGEGASEAATPAAGGGKSAGGLE